MTFLELISVVIPYSYQPVKKANTFSLSNSYLLSSWSFIFLEIIALIVISVWKARNAKQSSLTSPMTNRALNAPKLPWHRNKAPHTVPSSSPAAGARRPGPVPPLAATQRQEPPGRADTNQAVCNASGTSD